LGGSSQFTLLRRAFFFRTFMFFKRSGAVLNIELKTGEILEASENNASVFILDSEILQRFQNNRIHTILGVSIDFLEKQDKSAESRGFHQSSRI
jgi:hypothetical protein